MVIAGKLASGGISSRSHLAHKSAAAVLAHAQLSARLPSAGALVAAVIDALLALLALEAGVAQARVVVHALLAIPRAQRVTRVGGTFVHVPFAQRAFETGRTAASEVSDSIDALPAVQTGLTFALVLVDLAQAPGRSARAGAHERVHQVDAHAGVLAGLGRAVVDVVFAGDALEPGSALAAEVALPVLTHRTVQTRVSGALVDGQLAVRALKAAVTDTLEARARRVHAGAVPEADRFPPRQAFGFGEAVTRLTDGQVAQLPRPFRRAHADSESTAAPARGPVLARRPFGATRVRQRLTTRPSEAGGAHTTRPVVSRALTSASVQAAPGVAGVVADLTVRAPEPRQAAAESK